MIRGQYLLVLLGFMALSAYSQPYKSKHGKFEVDQREGCAPFAVTINVLPPFDCTGQCDIDPYGNNNFINLVTPFVYDTPGTHWLRLLIGGSGGQNEVDSVQVTVRPNIKPAFELYSCGNNEVSVSIKDTNYDQYVVEYSDGTTVALPATTKNHRHTFPGSGQETVTVRGKNIGAADNCGDSIQTISVMQTLPAPTIARITIPDETRIQLELITLPHILYRLEVGTNTNGSFQLARTIYNSTVEVVNNLRPDDNYYCFRVGSYDPCNNTTVYSPVMCTAEVDLDVENNVNNFIWDTNTSGVVTRRVRRLTVPTGNVLTSIETGPFHADTDIECGVEYCYQLIMDYPNGAQSISLEKCGTAISSDIPDAIENITASANLPGVDLVWEAPQSFTPQQYNLYSENGTLLAMTSTADFYVEPFQTGDRFCYQISYTDVCGNLSPRSAPACPILLIGQLQADNTVILGWNAYEGWSNGVAGYVVEKYNGDGQLLDTYDVGLSLSFADVEKDPADQTSIYIVRGTPEDAGLTPAISNPATVTREPNLFYPTGFTPNGDNLNDIFNVYGQYVRGFQMSIFNRWGELLYTTSDLDSGWDGTFNGHTMPEGTYTFVAEITDLAGRNIRKSGSFFLLHKGK